MSKHKDERPPRVRAARRWLAQNGGPIQQMLNKDDPGMYVITDWNGDGEEIVFVTKNDELIVDYYDRIQTGELLAMFLAGGGTVGQG
jgi:hypothetical protein